MSGKIADILDLVAVIELENILVNEERARRLSWSDEELASREFPISTNSLGISGDKDRLRFRFRALFTDADGEYTADLEAIYVLTEPMEVEQPVLHEFASRVAFMAVYPFLRSSIFGSATRLGLPVPVLGIVRQGDMQPGDQMSEEQVAAAFQDDRSETVTSDSK